MEVIIAKSFLKDIRSKPKSVVHAIEKLITQLEQTNNLEQSGLDCKKLEG